RGTLLLTLLAFPFRRRPEPLHFIRKIDPALDAEPERGRPLVDLVDTDQVGDRVEIHVARLLDRMAQIDRAVAPLLPALERTPIECGGANAMRVEIGRDDPFFERG